MTRKRLDLRAYSLVGRRSQAGKSTRKGWVHVKTKAGERVRAFSEDGECAKRDKEHGTVNRKGSTYPMKGGE